MVEIPNSLYTSPSLFDILYTPGTAREVDILQKIARRYGRADNRLPCWLEPACGTGRYLRCLARRGQRIVGFDRDPAMIAYANATLRRRRLQRRAWAFAGDMTDFAIMLPPGSIDFACNPVNSIRHLEDDRQLLAHLDQMATVLRPGAVYAVGVSLRNRTNDFPNEEVWEGRRGRCTVRQVVTYLPPPAATPASPTTAEHAAAPRFETVLCHLQIRRPRGEEHRDARFRLRSFDRDEWRALIERSALFRVASLDAAGEARGERIVSYQFEILGRS